MALYERLLGRDDQGEPVDGKIRVHGFCSLMGEVARGRLTGAQAQAAIPQISRGGPLAPDEVAEAQALLASITGLAANQRLPRAKEIDDVLILAEAGVAQYDTPAEVKSRLGV